MKIARLFYPALFVSFAGVSFSQQAAFSTNLYASEESCASVMYDKSLSLSEYARWVTFDICRMSRLSDALGPPSDVAGLDLAPPKSPSASKSMPNAGVMYTPPLNQILEELANLDVEIVDQPAKNLRPAAPSRFFAQAAAGIAASGTSSRKSDAASSSASAPFELSDVFVSENEDSEEVSFELEALPSLEEPSAAAEIDFERELIVETRPVGFADLSEEYLERLLHALAGSNNDLSATLSSERRDAIIEYIDARRLGEFGLIGLAQADPHEANDLLKRLLGGPKKLKAREPARPANRMFGRSR